MGPTHHLPSLSAWAVSGIRGREKRLTIPRRRWGDPRRPRMPVVKAVFALGTHSCIDLPSSNPPLANHLRSLAHFLDKLSGKMSRLLVTACKCRQNVPNALPPFGRLRFPQTCVTEIVACFNVFLTIVVNSHIVRTAVKIIPTSGGYNPRRWP